MIVKTSFPQNTFKDNAEVLHRLEKESQWVEKCLSYDFLSGAEGRHKMLVESLIKSQIEITQLIHNCLINSPQKVLKNYNQFSAEGNKEIISKESNISGYSIRKAMRRNNEIREEVKHLINTDQNEFSRTMFENLYSMIDMKIRCMSMAVQTAGDV